MKKATEIPVRVPTSEPVAKSAPEMRLFMVETYEARGRIAEHADCRWRARAAADALAREGTRVLYVRSVFVPEDETAFHFFEALAPEAVMRVIRLARLSFPRVVEAAE